MKKITIFPFIISLSLCITCEPMIWNVRFQFVISFHRIPVPLFFHFVKHLWYLQKKRRRNTYYYIWKKRNLEKIIYVVWKLTWILYGWNPMSYSYNRSTLHDTLQCFLNLKFTCAIQSTETEKKSHNLHSEKILCLWKKLLYNPC